FLSYMRGADPDESVALEISAALCRQYAVFVDPELHPSMNWAERIHAELRQADVVIVLLSAQSIHSELVATELANAAQMARAHGGRPAILLVRLAYYGPLPYPLSTYLEGCAWTAWDSPGDTARLIDELRGAVAGGALPVREPISSADL